MASPVSKAASLFLQDTSNENATKEFMGALTSCVHLLPDNRLDDYAGVLSENKIILNAFGLTYFDRAYQPLGENLGHSYVGCVGDARLLVQALRTQNHGLLWLVTTFLSSIVALSDPRRNVTTMNTMQEFVVAGGVSSLFEVLATTDQWAPGGGGIQKRKKKGKLSKSRRNKLTAITIENILNITANLITRVSGSSRLARKCTFATGAVSCALSMLASTEAIDDGWKPFFVRQPASLFLLNMTNLPNLGLFRICPIEELVSQLVSNVLIEGRFKKTLHQMESKHINPDVLKHTLALICNLCCFPIQDVVRNYIESSDLTIKNLVRSSSLLIRSYNAKKKIHKALLTIIAYACEMLGKLCRIAAEEKRQSNAPSTSLPSLYSFIKDHFLALGNDEFLRMYALIRHDTKSVATSAVCLINGLSGFESNEIDILLLGTKTTGIGEMLGLSITPKAERKLISVALKLGYSKEGKSGQNPNARFFTTHETSGFFDQTNNGIRIIEECFNPKCSRESRAEAWLLSPAGAGWDPKKLNQPVVIRGLISRPELNGMGAVSLALKLGEKGSFEDRITVMVTGNKQKFNLKPACLLPDLAFNSPVVQRRDFQKCSRCKTAQYCSRDCQTEHWSVHKKLCKKLVLKKSKKSKKSKKKTGSI